MVKAIAREITLQREYVHNETIQTIYFGGGTPSLLEEDELVNLLSVLKENFAIEKGAEITLEANPEDLNASKLAALRRMGINRLSVGIQSFDDTILQFLNRNHTAAQSIDAIQLARSAGFSNLSIDLIFAIPGQSIQQLVTNVENVIALSPEHISAYSLTIEPRTVFGNWSEKGKLAPVGDEVAADEMMRVTTILSNAGYEHYEISNFSKPGYHSRHNSSYWKQQKYLGVGPGAHSYDGNSRQFNVKHNAAYIRSIEKGTVPFEKEHLSKEDLINEYILTTLRTSAGCDMQFISERFDYRLADHHRDFLNKLQLEGLLLFDDRFLKLTSKGRLVADKISSDLFLAT